MLTIKKQLSVAGETTQLFQGIWVQVLAPMPGGSQLPAIPASGHMTPSSGLHGQLHFCAHPTGRHTHTQTHIKKVVIHFEISKPPEQPKHTHENTWNINELLLFYLAAGPEAMRLNNCELKSQKHWIHRTFFRLEVTSPGVLSQRWEGSQLTNMSSSWHFLVL